MRWAGWAETLPRGAVPAGCAPRPRKRGAWAERVGQGERVPSSLRGGRGECGYPAAAGSPILSPPMGSSSCSPPSAEVRTEPQTAVGMVEGESPLLPFPSRPRGGSAPGAPSITHPSLVPFHSNQAAVTGLSPNLLPRAAAGRGSEPRTRSLRGVASLDSALCLRPTSGRPLEASSASLAGFLEEAARKPEKASYCPGRGALGFFPFSFKRETRGFPYHLD